MTHKIVIVDGNSLINRAYFAMSELKNSKGIYMGGVYGLTNMVLNLIDNFGPTHFCVAFDMKGPTKRHETYEAYKGTRKGMPDELAMQMPIVKEVLDVLKIPRMELQGYEADDLIGTLSNLCRLDGFEVNVITGDKDALQLVDLGVRVHITKKGISELKEYADEDVFEELGVHSNQVIDYKGLSGDASDNIPGIPGVGPKTAAKLLDVFGTVENLVVKSDEIENKRIRGLVQEYSDQALLSKKLATIFLNVPAEMDLEEFKLKTPDTESVIEVLKYYELNNILTKFKSQTDSTENRALISYKIVDGEELNGIIEKSSAFAFKLFYSDLRTDLKAAVFSVNSQVYALDNPNEIISLKPSFEDARIAKIGYDVKNEYLYLMSLGIDMKGVAFDGYIAAYLLDPSRRNYDLSEIYFEYASMSIESNESFFGRGAKKIDLNTMETEKFLEYAAEQVSVISELCTILTDKIKASGVEKLFSEVEMPLVKILSDIEHVGFSVDLEQIDLIDAQLIEKLTQIEKDVYEMAGETFNINSPKQLGTILFEKLGLPAVKKTKTGYSTNHDVLEKLINKHPIVSEIIEYRTYSKLKSTYIDGLRNVIDYDNKRVHTSLNQTVTVTGRLSSTEPNLQNIPIKLPYGRKIRRFFVADPGCILLGADYSQIELRVLAHLSRDEKLIEAFSNNLDIHTITASQVFKIPENEVSSLQRSRAKEVNFGIVYGMGDFGLSESLGISRKEAKAYIENYFESYPKVQGFMTNIIDNCKANGYVETILNRRRYVPDIDSKNFMLRSSAERIARNTPIQGSAADIIKIAMIKVYNSLIEHNLKSKLILQVHDELILNVPMDELEVVKGILKDSMENAIELCVPLNVDMNTGGSWYDAK